MTTLSPPWGHDLEESCCTAASGTRPSTRTEMVRARREKEASYAQKITPRGGAAVSQVVVPQDWWKLVEGYRENPYDDLASSPRFQRYMKRRAQAHSAAERPDPFNTHEVRLRKPARPWAEKISLAKPPPADADVYFASKKTINKRFTGDYFAWKARLISHGDLDERGKNRRVTPGECLPPYSSLASTFTGCSIDPENNIRSPRQAMGALRAMPPHPLDRPSAAEVARKAVKQRRIVWKEILAAAASKPRRRSGCGSESSADFEGGDYHGGRNSRPASASSACSKNAAARTCGETQIRPPSAPPESNHRRYSRLCGQG